MAEQRTSSPTRKAARNSLWSVTACLCCLWAASLLYGEIIAFWIPVWTCSWPSLTANPKANSLDRIVKVAVIGDPQLTDRTTHGMKPGSFALKATQLYSDIYMRRAFRTSVLALHPDEIVFLGDYFDGGLFLSEEEFKDSLRRFKHIFDQSNRVAKTRFSSLPFYYLFGNHDLGYAGEQSARPELRERYEKEFGPIEHMDKIGAVDFVFVDSQSLDGTNTDVRTNGAWQFIQNVSSEAYKHSSKVLLSHIPLYRPDDTPCGALRASEEINQRITWSRSGFPRIMYQNYLSEESTVRLLDLLKPALILSGHDHDQCSIKHRVSSISAIEHTVGTFSWQNGNLYPSFMLLSVNRQSPRSDEGLLASRVCFLPYQTFTYIWYAILFVISVVTLLFWPSQGIDWNSVAAMFKPQGNSKEKEEDPNEDYDMVWDSEGNMHLIKKAFKQPDRKSKENTEIARSTALAQSVVKRVTPSDPSNSASVMTSANDHFIAENNVGVVGRSRKVSIVARRIRLAIGPFVVLASVNAALYVMLMMNDWTGV